MEANFKQTTTDKEERYSLFLPQFELLIRTKRKKLVFLPMPVPPFMKPFGFLGRFLSSQKMINSFLGPFQGSVACYHIRKGKGVMRNFMG